MKKTFFLIAVIALSIVVYAQNENSKLHSNLQKFIDKDESVRVLVQFEEKPGDAHRNFLNEGGCRAEYTARHINLVVADCPGRSLEGLSKSDKVKFVWENEIFEPLLDYSAGQISADDVWALGYNGSGVNVSILDSGIDTNHPALQGKVILEHDFTPDNTTADLCGHGTRVASIVASVNDTYRGVAPGASLFNAKVGGSAWGCMVSVYAMIAAIDWSVEHGAQVISMSFGGPNPNCSESIGAIYVDQTVIQDNIPVVIGAGNGGPSSQSIYAPGCAEKAITVGAVNDYNYIADFSSRGPAVGDTTWVKPDVVAPGVDIYSANVGGAGFSPDSGTSYSTPHVSAVVALMLQAKPGLSQGQVKDIIKNSSTDLGYDENTQGEGLVNASAAVDLALNTTPEVFTDYPGLLAYYTSAGADLPKARNVLDASFSDEFSALSLGSGADLVWVRTAAAPTREEDLVVTQDDLDQVVIQVHTNFAPFRKFKVLGTAGSSSERRFDVAYEQSSGRGMIVYSNNSATPAYALWDGAAYQFGSLAVDDCNGTTTWIAVVAKPGSNEMVEMYQDSDGAYCAQVWNGAAWGNAKKFTADTGTSTQKFDVIYEQSSGQALAVFESATAGKIAYCEWNGTDWCSSNTLLSDRGDQNDWVKLAALAGSNRILLGAFQLGDADVDVIEWDGAGFGSWKQIDKTVESTSGVNRIVDVAYVGTTGQGMVVYVDADTKVPSYAVCTSAANCFGGTWSSVSTTTNSSNNCGEASDLDYVALAEDPQSSKVLLYALSQSSHYKCAQFYNGTAWGTWYSNLGSGTVNAGGEDVSAVFDIV